MGGHDYLHAIRFEEVLLFLGDLIGDGTDDSIPSHRSNDGQTDPGVAAGRFHDGSTWFQEPLFFRPVDHGHRDTFLDRPAHADVFGLGDQVARRVEAGQADERSVSNRLDGVFVDSHEPTI